MKKVVIYLLFAIFIIVSLLLIFNNGQIYKSNKNLIDDLEFKEKQNYLLEHKNDLGTVTVRHITLGGDEIYQIDSEEVYDLFKKVEKIIISNVSVTDDYYSYQFDFKNGKSIVFSFEGNYYVEGRNAYRLIDFLHPSNYKK